MNHPPPMEEPVPRPVSALERRFDLDLVRGFALWGIVFVNIGFFAMPFYWAYSDLDPHAGPATSVSRALVSIFFEGKFITLFSFLFGLGFAMFAQRARERGGKAGPLFFRRVLVLGILGSLHAFLVWAGDVLLTYAILALFLLLFLNRKPVTILVWAVLLPLAHWALFALMAGFVQLALRIPDMGDVVREALEEARWEMEAMADRALAAFQSQDWSAMFFSRLEELGFYYQGMLLGSPGFGYLMGVFLLGLYAGRRGWFSSIDQSLPLWRKRLWWLFPLGLSGSVLNYLLLREADILIPGLPLVVYSLVFVLTTPLLTAAYVIALLLLQRKTLSWPLWRWLASAGRMSLTVYLGQSLLFTTLFYGYGAGWYGRMAHPWLIPVAAGGQLLLTLLALTWLKAFHHGPMEFLWRALVYGRFPPMRKK